MKNRYKAASKDFDDKYDASLLSIGNKLHSLRKERKAGLNTVAKAIKMSPTLISKIEKGQHDFKLLQLIRLCGYYKVNILEIMKQS